MKQSLLTLIGAAALLSWSNDFVQAYGDEDGYGAEDAGEEEAVDAAEEGGEEAEEDSGDAAAVTAAAVEALKPGLCKPIKKEMGDVDGFKACKMEVKAAKKAAKAAKKAKAAPKAP